MRLAARGRAVVRVRAARPRARRAGGPGRGGAPPGRRHRALRDGRRPLAGAVRGGRRPIRRTNPTAPGRSPSVGFAFAPDGGGAPHWRGFEPASLIVPEVALTRASASAARTSPRRCALTLAALAAPDDTAEELLARLERRVAELRRGAAAAARPGADGALPGRQRDAARALRGRGRARRRADPRRGAREGRAGARGPGARAARARPGRGVRRAARGVSRLLRLLRRARRRDARRRQPRAAGAPRGPPRAARSRSPARRAAAPTPPSTTTSASSCCATRATARSTRSSRGGSSARCASTRSGSPRPPSRRSCRIANIQHLATPIRAQLAQPIDAIELAGLMHPTPAVGGEPRRAAAAADPGARGPRPRLVRRPGRLDRRRPATASSASPCAARCCAGASRAATPASASCATPTPPPSWRRPRSSCRRCCRCWLGERVITGPRRGSLGADDRLRGSGPTVKPSSSDRRARPGGAADRERAVPRAAEKLFAVDARRSRGRRIADGAGRGVRR